MASDYGLRGLFGLLCLEGGIGLRLSSRGPGCRVEIAAAEDLYGTNLASTGMYNERGAHASRDAAAQQHIIYSQPNPPIVSGSPVPAAWVPSSQPVHVPSWNRSFVHL